MQKRLDSGFQARKPSRFTVTQYSTTIKRSERFQGNLEPEQEPLLLKIRLPFARFD